MKHFSKAISCTDRWTGNEHKVMARVLLPIIDDLLYDKMVGSLGAYLDVIQLTYYMSHMEETVEYLRTAINKYTRLQNDLGGPLVQLRIHDIV